MKMKGYPMKFKSIAIPEPSKGAPGGRPAQVVPDQSLDLKEILARFVRKEPLPVGHTGYYGSDGEIDPESESEFNIDQEKAKGWDLTEKFEFSEKVQAEVRKHEAEESRRKAKEASDAAAKARADYEKAVRIAARKLAKKAGEKPPSI